MSRNGNRVQSGQNRSDSSKFGSFVRYHRSETERIAAGYADLIRKYLGANYSDPYMNVMGKTEVDDQYFGDSADIFAAMYYMKNYEGVESYAVM